MALEVLASSLQKADAYDGRCVRVEAPMPPILEAVAHRRALIHQFGGAKVAVCQCVSLCRESILI